MRDSQVFTNRETQIPPLSGVVQRVRQANDYTNKQGGEGGIFRNNVIGSQSVSGVVVKVQYQKLNFSGSKSNH